MQPFKGLRRLGRSFAGLLRPAALAETTVSGPSGDDLPTPDEIMAAAERHEEAREEYNGASRTKRAARRVLDRVPTGIYGPWAVAWVQPARREWDREAIAAFYHRHGEEVPTRPAPLQLKLTRVVTEPVAVGPPPGGTAPDPVREDAGTAPEMVAAIFGAARPEGLS
ncbi:hypothetical protein ACI2LJ_36000 [Streptomyces sp. NPDC088090]|uniref:hypothetical protein n=1 Tax=Streptomyces sp. NPDC088090 TaxID=3365822 RepID=UPI00384D8626